jgi:hypothetical protein
VLWPWSPDSRLAGTELMPDGRRLGVLACLFESGHFEKLTDFGYWPVWLKDSRRLLFPADEKLILIDRKTNEIREVLSAAPHLIQHLSMSADNRTV